MSLGLFFHHSQNAKTTLSEIRRIHDMVGSTEAYCLYAYATQSGLAAFDLEFSRSFWEATNTRWLFGIDYGRTQPLALQAVCERPNAQVRVYDGEWVVRQEGFLPRRDFHPKTSFFARPLDGRYGAVAGSGNFSSNGLKLSIEAGAAVYSDCDHAEEFLLESLGVANDLWERAAPAEEILEDYHRAWSGSFFRRGENAGVQQEIPGARRVFWIEAGYVTRNRGPFKPGNQIDLPRGMSKYFNFHVPADQPLNSIIGEIRFFTPSGDSVARNLRLGNNAMEKITLPIPEAYGYDMYDGKVIVFVRSDGGFLLSALEAADFEATFGDRLSLVMSMGSGRRYGHIE